MRYLLLAAALLPFAAAAPASAMSLPAVSAMDSGIVAVSGGCGPGGHRGYYGRCVPNFARGYPVRRFCPPGLHPTPYGCRPNF